MTSGIEPGREWAQPIAGPPDLTVDGDDAALASAVRAHHGALVWWRPTEGADLARALGLVAGDVAGDVPGAREVTVDAIEVENRDTGGREAGDREAGDREAGGRDVVNALVVGVPPHRVRLLTPSAPVEVVVDGRPWFSGRATTVVVANGQFVAGRDVVPRGHPGDGRLEIQVYGLRRGERAAMRRRLTTGSHLPHPRIATISGRRIEVRAARPVPVTADGVALGARRAVVARVLPGAARIAL